MKSLLLKSILVLIVLSFTFSSSAQFSMPQTAPAIKLTPEFPTPGASIKAELISYSTDLERATITWALDKKVILKGEGESEVTFAAAGRGLTNALSATAVSAEGQTFTASITIRPQSVYFLTESKSKVPSWYKGAAMPSAGSKILVTAMPDFITGKTAINPASLYYTWRVDNRQMPKLSGKGRRSISVVSEGIGLPKQIEVKVATSDGRLAQKAFIMVEARPQEVLFYEKNSSGPITSRAIQRINMSPDSKFAIKAVPFFMNYAASSDLQFVWFQDSSPAIPISGEPDAMLIEAALGSGGQNASFNIFVTNTKNLLEKIGNSINVEVR